MKYTTHLLADQQNSDLLKRLVVDHATESEPCTTIFHSLASNVSQPTENVQDPSIPRAVLLSHFTRSTIYKHALAVL